MILAILTYLLIVSGSSVSNDGALVIRLALALLAVVT